MVCECSGRKLNGEIEGIRYEICVTCERLYWVASGPADLIRGEITLGIEFLEAPESGEIGTRRQFLNWLDGVLAQVDLPGSFSVAWDAFDDEELEELLEDESVVTLSHSMSNCRFDVSDDDESAYEGEITNLMLASASAEEIMKRAVRQLWDEMGEYRQKDIAIALASHLSQQKFRELTVEFGLDHYDLEWTLKAYW